MENEKNQLDLFENTLETMLKNYKIPRLEKFEDLKKYFDISKLDEDKTPSIETENKTVLIFDNETFNETYLLDVVCEYLLTHSWIAENVDIVYIDNFDVRMKLFAEQQYNKYWDKNEVLPHQEFEKKHLVPGIMTINPIENQINFFGEALVPFDLKKVQQIFLSSKIEE